MFMFLYVSPKKTANRDRYTDFFVACLVQESPMVPKQGVFSLEIENRACRRAQNIGHVLRS